MIIHSVDRAAKIINQMRDFARSSGAVPNIIDPTAPVENSLIFFRRQFKQHEISLVLDYGENLPKVFLDSQKLEQVFVNLFSNAHFAVDERGKQETGDYRKEIRVSVTHDGSNNSLIMEVSDNGTGMTPEEKKQCVDPFFTTKEVGEGTGLGLSICHGIIKEFDGALEIESEQGSGTKIMIAVPVAEKNDD